MTTTQYKITVGGCELTVFARMCKTGISPPNWGSKSKPEPPTHNRFRITVRVDGKKQAGFNFYGSTADYEMGKTELEPEDIRDALDAILSDALSGACDFSEFCGEFGYDEDSRTAEKIYKACQESADDLREIGINEDAARTIADKLREEGEKEV